MPRVRQRKLPITDTLKQTTSTTTSRSTRTVIRRFHTLLKRQSQLSSQPRTVERTQELQQIEHEIEQLGGLSEYQRMSSIGQSKERGGGSEKVFISWLKQLNLADRKGKGKMRLLEVGALKPDNYVSSSWIECTPIDLHSRHPDITEQDFLRMDVEQHRGHWDLISLSLVVNFVPDPRDRGRMLSQAHQMLRNGGYLFLALPLPCVTNSRYATVEHLNGLMRYLGFEKVYERWRQGGKMAYWLFQADDQSHPLQENTPYSKKSVLLEGNRNNFCILL